MTTQKTYQGGASVTTLSANVGSGDLSFSVTVGANLPAGSSAAPFVATIERLGANEEKILCYRVGNAITVITRGYDNTTARAHNGGVNIEHTVDGASLQDFNNHATNAALDEHAQYLRTDGTRVLTGVSAIAAAPGVSHAADTAAKGAGPALALADHTHGRVAPSSAYVQTSEATASGAYTDLATVTDTVTFTVPASGNVKVTITSSCSTAGAATAGFVGVAASGGNTVAATDNRALHIPVVSSDAADRLMSAVFPWTGLTPGSTTFKLKYRTLLGISCSFGWRSIIVEEA